MGSTLRNTHIVYLTFNLLPFSLAFAKIYIYNLIKYIELRIIKNQDSYAMIYVHQ